MSAAVHAFSAYAEGARPAPAARSTSVAKAVAVVRRMNFPPWSTVGGVCALPPLAGAGGDLALDRRAGLSHAQVAGAAVAARVGVVRAPDRIVGAADQDAVALVV